MFLSLFGHAKVGRIALFIGDIKADFLLQSTEPPRRQKQNFFMHSPPFLPSRFGTARQRKQSGRETYFGVVKKTKNSPAARSVTMDIVKTGGICSKYCLSGKVEKEEEEEDPFGVEGKVRGLSWQGCETMVWVAFNARVNELPITANPVTKFPINPHLTEITSKPVIYAYL